MDTGADKTGVRGPAGHQYLSTHDHAHSLPHHQHPRDHQLSPGDQGDGQPHRDPGPGHGAPRREALDSLVTEFRDSSVYPLILNPLTVSYSLCLVWCLGPG